MTTTANAVGERRKHFGFGRFVQSERSPIGAVPRRLDLVVSSVAAQLMDATASTAAELSQKVLANLVEQFGADAGFLRHNDHNIRASKLIAEWPPRPDRPGPDPLEVVHFTSAAPVFAYCAHRKEPVVIQPGSADYVCRAYQGRIAESRRVASPSVAAAPLVSRGVTTGLLGFIKFEGDRTWKPELIDTLGAIASLFAQLRTKAGDVLTVAIVGPRATL